MKFFPILIGLPTFLTPLAGAQTPRFDLERRALPYTPFAVQAQLAELTGDNDLDLLLHDATAVRVIAGDGHGTFRDVVTEVPLSDVSTSTGALFDMDGDGDLDYVVPTADGGAPVTRLFRNDGAGTLTDVSGQLPPIVATAISLAIAGDVDADGDQDLVMLGAPVGFPSATSPVLVCKNDGAGNFTFDSSLLLGDWVLTAALVDLDGDQAAEFVYSRTDPLFGGVLNPNGAELLTNDGTGVFTPAPGALPVVAGTVTARRITGVDLDGDGDRDLVVGVVVTDPSSPSSESALQVTYTNDGVGGMSLGALPLSALEGHHLLAAEHVVGDVDGDGDPDLLAIGAEESEILLNDGAGGFTAAHSVDGLTAERWVGRPSSAADVDGDGDDDLLVGADLFLADPSGALHAVSEATPLARPVMVAFESTVGDFDGDGDADVLVAYEASLELFRNDGAGRFAREQVDVAGHRRIDAADLNGDGSDDFLSLRNGFPTAYLGGSAGLVGPVVLPWNLAWLPSLAAFGDVDGDGDVDVVLARGGEAVRILENPGNGALTLLPVGSATPLADPRDLVLADFDGDGDLDVHVGTRGLSNVGGAFVDVGWSTPQTSSAPLTLATGDFDGNGTADLFVGTQVPDSSFLPDLERIYLGSGTGDLFDFSPGLGGLADYVTDVLVEDFDGDGDDDVLLVGGLGKLLEQTAAGLSTVPGAIGSGMLFESVVAADFDGDGDLDLHQASSEGNVTLFGQGTQLNARNVPRVGRPLSFEVSGPANGACLVAWSNGSGPLALANLGTLWLDPARIVTVGTTVLDADGVGSLPAAIPASPSLLGRTFYAQALFGSPLVLSNLETLPIRDL